LSADAITPSVERIRTYGLAWRLISTADTRNPLASRSRIGDGASLFVAVHVGSLLTKQPRSQKRSRLARAVPTPRACACAAGCDLARLIGLRCCATVWPNPMNASRQLVAPGQKRAAAACWRAFSSRPTRAANMRPSVETGCGAPLMASAPGVYGASERFRRNVR
jgi:hypothetical protein